MEAEIKKTNVKLEILTTAENQILYYIRERERKKCLCDDGSPSFLFFGNVF